MWREASDPRLVDKTFRVALTLDAPELGLDDYLVESPFGAGRCANTTPPTINNVCALTSSLFSSDLQRGDGVLELEIAAAPLPRTFTLSLITR